MRVFLVSGYHSGSHSAWAEGYARSSGHEVHLVTMPGSFWQWRLTGGFVSLAEGVQEAATAFGPPDVLLATSLVDVAGLRGLVSKTVGVVPTALYMHENQVTYPAISRSRTERNYGLINWTSLLAADGVAFNSEFHRQALFAALPGFLCEFPDQRQGDLIASVLSKAIVLPVGCDLATIPRGPKDDPPLILWNHRWDTDKDPAAFLDFMGVLAERQVPFRIALTGERFVKQRPSHDDVIGSLGDLVVVDDHLVESEYRELLGRASIVVSTALQEFFGVSVVEAMAAGAFPILPRRLVYPERIPPGLAERSLYDSPAEAVALLVSALSESAATRRLALRLSESVSQYDWGVMASRYDDWLDSIVPSERSVSEDSRSKR